jgi:hypothetical protein
VLNPLITRDPVSGRELIVTRLECPESGIVIEGHFSLGWVGKLTPEQLDFVGVLLRNRNNVQKIANDLGVAYNTARSRLDDIVAALGGDVPESAARLPAGTSQVKKVIDGLASGELSFEEALAALKRSEADA